MSNQKAEVKFMKETGQCESPGVYIRYEKLTMARPTMRVFGDTLSIETAVELIDGLATALEEYEVWENEQTAE